jgi:hypothetical protein
MNKQNTSIVERLIQHIEEQIKRWMYDQFKRRIGVSVQLPTTFQGVRRPEPANIVCRSIYHDDRLRECCDISDQYMKNLAKENELSIAYRCHHDLSNIVIREWDTNTSAPWFIFLGQFAIAEYGKCGGCVINDRHCKATQRILENESIKILDDKTMERMPAKVTHNCSQAVKSGFFTNSGKVPQEFVLDIHQLIMCKRKAVEVFHDEIKQAARNQRTLAELKRHCQKFSGPGDGSSNLNPAVQHQKPF